MFLGWQWLLLALGITLVVEGAVMLPRYKESRAYFAMVLLANIATNLTLNLVLYGLRLLTTSVIWLVLGVVVLEACAVVAEYFVCRQYDKKPHLFWWVLAANVLSVAIGTPIVALL